MISADGDVVWVQDHVSVERRHGRPHILRGFMLDITERKHAEEVLRESEAALRLGHEKIQYLAGELIKTQETERRHVALELHEDVNQKLAALSRSSEHVGKRAFRARRVCSKDGRRPSGTNGGPHRRRTPPVSGAPSRGDRACRSRRRPEVALPGFQEEGEHLYPNRCRDSPDPVPFDIALCLYRITEESLRNIQRHSGAASATVRLAAEKNGLHLAISDDGVGFDIKEARPAQGVGLLSMEERVRLLNGSFRIESRPGGGTELEVFVPVSDQSQKPSFPKPA